MAKAWLAAAAVSGFFTVALGAFGAHSLKHLLDAYGKSIYETAVLYQMFHTLALVAVGLLQHLFKQVRFGPAGWGFLVGILLFSGSLYLMAVSGLRWLGAVTPVGGTAFLFGWVWLIYGVFRIRPGRPVGQ
jgi:uncharacterized membrane protein YgdD (TMEM256/DUF423 family)